MPRINDEMCRGNLRENPRPEVEVEKDEGRWSFKSGIPAEKVFVVRSEMQAKLSSEPDRSGTPSEKGLAVRKEMQAELARRLEQSKGLAVTSGTPTQKGLTVGASTSSRDRTSCSESDDQCESALFGSCLVFSQKILR